MKRTIVLILSIMLAGIAVFGFAACDKLQTFEGITLTSQTFFYDGNAKSIYADNIPDGATVSYDGNGQSAPGVYEVQATVTAEGYKTLILKATLTVAGTMQWLKTEYEKDLLAAARKINEGSPYTGEYDCVILGKADTLANLANYSFSEEYDKNAVCGGLFVRYDAKETESSENILYTAYYNYAIEFDRDMKKITVSTAFNGDTWELSPIPGNNKILFQYDNLPA